MDQKPTPTIEDVIVILNKDRIAQQEYYKQQSLVHADFGKKLISLDEKIEPIYKVYSDFQGASRITKWTTKFILTLGGVTGAVIAIVAFIKAVFIHVNFK